MSGWQPLPDGLPPEVRHFVTRLRDLKDATGLSLAALGARTAYSKSSWQRYLNAVQPPPRQAVAALARVAGLDAPDTERLAVRWEVAMEAWPRPERQQPEGGGTGAPDGDGAGYEDDPTLPWWERPEEPPRRPPSGRLLLWAVLLLLALLLTAVVGTVAAG
ncbi:helix-turn-helix domain-containing protein [Streptomyces griseosporeus]|uniref:helix-turn-helix domain-containing protein n=1 Tax=Streptomyces griseosporeus TaxID=1910 RepID=UPI0036FC6855